MAVVLCCLFVDASRVAAQGQGPPAAAQLITIRRGTLPIVLSAPHGGNLPIPNVPPRVGTGVDKFAKVRDEQTSELAHRIADALDQRLGGRVALVVARFDRKFLDANRPASGAYESPAAKLTYDAYHAALTEACREIERTWGRGLLVDVHGQAAEPRAIFRGTANGQSITHLMQRFGREALDGPSSIPGGLEAGGYKLIPPGGSSDAEDRRFNGGYIVRTYGSAHGGTIDALQLEFGGELRQKQSLDRTAADVAAAVAAFAGKYLPRSKRPAPVGID